MYQTIHVTTDQRGILYVSLNRPEVRNAFNDQLIRDLSSAFSNEVRRNDVRAVVLKGEGPIFCAGGDLNWMKNAATLTLEENFADARRLAQLFADLNECPKPVIGSIHGAAIGGGVGLVSICDIAIATADTQFSLSEVRLGIIPACIGPFVTAKIGPSLARALFVGASRFQGAKAKEMGLIHEVAANLNELKALEEKYLENLLQCGPNALVAAKKSGASAFLARKAAQSHELSGYGFADLSRRTEFRPKAKRGCVHF